MYDTEEQTYIAISVLLNLSKWVSGWMGEWLLFYANLAIFQLYHGKNKLIFNEMMMKSALY